jgi:hypothetical protein
MGSIKRLRAAKALFYRRWDPTGQRGYCRETLHLRADSLRQLNHSVDFPQNYRSGIKIALVFRDLLLQHIYFQEPHVRAIVKKILLQGALLLGVQAAAHASPILLVSNGILLGAQGVEVGGQQYDVQFSDVRPTAGNLLFDSLDDSWAASTALSNLVFQGVYDTSPGLTNGCSSRSSCSIITAFDVGSLSLFGTAFTNTIWRVDGVTPYLHLGRGNPANSPLGTYANWSLRLPEEEQQAVPEPSSLLLAGAGLAAMLARRKFRPGARRNDVA